MHTVEVGIVACDIFFIGGLAMCDSLWQMGSNLVKKSMAYFFNGPHSNLI